MKKLILFIAFTPLFIFANDLNLMIGFKNTNILWENPGKKLMGPQVDEGEDFIRGGSFDVSQPGIAFRADYHVNKDFVIPVGVDYTFFSAKELIPINEFIYGRLEHHIDFIGVYSGLYYNIKRYGFMGARLYGGLEIRGSYLSNIKYENYLIFKQLPELNEHNQLPSKDNAFRLGTTAKIGVDSQLNKYVNFNINLSYSIINLIGTNDTRGELFTPQTQFETGESLVHMFHITLMLQYDIEI